MIKKWYVLLFLFFSLNSCDILRSSPFEVTSWTPGEGFHSEAERIVVSLKFSHEADRESVERHFTLTGDGNRIKGGFAWNGRQMSFISALPLEKNTEYAINLSANAHDVSGLSMDESFYRRFTTRNDNIRPVLLSSYPETYSQIDNLRTEIELYFSKPVVLDTLYENVSFNPSMTGSWRLENNGRLAIFTPVEPWAQQSRYQINISQVLTDNNNNNIGNEHSINFTTNTDNEAPYLLEAKRITKENDSIKLYEDRGYNYVTELLTENNGWEKDDKLLLVFSKPVDSFSVKNLLTAEGAPSLVLETQPGYNEEIIFRFDGIPSYESRFAFRLKPGVKDNAGNASKSEYIYRIFANGVYSRPPALAGIRMPMEPPYNKFLCYDIESLFTRIPLENISYPSNEQIETWIELYFFTAEEASIDPFTIMEFFRIETSNNVINFSPRQVRTSDFTIPEPQIGWENYQRTEVHGFLTNSTNFGIINFIIGSGLKDSLGNINDKTQKISVVK